jgi:hypothetical protein
MPQETYDKMVSGRKATMKEWAKTPTFKRYMARARKSKVRRLRSRPTPMIHTREEVLAVYEHRRSGWTLEAIAGKFRYSKSGVSHVLAGHCYRELWEQFFKAGGGCR